MKATTAIVLASLVLAGAQAGCSAGGDGGDAGIDSVTDPGIPQDAGAPGAGDATADDEVTPPGPCESLLKLEKTFDLFYAEPEGQIHVSAAFDGEGIWLAYNVPADDGSGKFDVHAARIDCNGSFLVDPFKVHEGELGNDIDPDVATGDGNVYVAWQTDTGGDPNLVIQYRAFKTDGTPLMQTEEKLEPVFAGQPLVASMWLTRVADLPGGRFAITGSWASQKAQRFQVFVQRVEATGALVSDAFEVFHEDQVSQTFPSIAALTDGTIHVAYTREEGDVSQVVHGAFAKGGTAIAPSPPAQAGKEPAVSSAMAAEKGPSGRVYLAYNTDVDDMDVVVTDAADFTDNAPSAVFGTAGKLDHTPGIAAGNGGGAVMWFRVRSGIRNDVLAQRFTYDGGALQAVGTERLLNPPDAGGDHAAPPVYTPAITHVRDHVYFTAWSEGKSPAFRLKGKFVDLD